MANESIGMAGFYWQEGAVHANINPSGTIYRKDMLLKYHKEVRDNDENVFYHPKGNKHGTDGGMDPTIKDVAGVFSETRGLKNPTEQQKEAMLRGAAPHVAWFEPGAYLYVRSIGEYGAIHVPCDHIYTDYGGYRAPEGTYYGGRNDCKFKHLWGGTRARDYLKHPVTDGFIKGCAPHWLKREDNIWKENVPENYHDIVHQIAIESNEEQKMRENLGCFVPEAM